ncbi:hypothetical protein HDU86_005112 [Geranomyces michiganensis]|nr:hypothetical protein HDU86_005112 [Geranomyces michiganensis]
MSALLPLKRSIPSLRVALPTFQVFAANTGVGKTLLSAALCRAAARAPVTALERKQWTRERDSSTPGRKVFYIKPVQTGYPEDSDARHVQQFCGSKRVDAKTLFTYREPAGAHLCAVQENRPVSDAELLAATRKAVDEAWTDVQESQTPGIVFLETAGGVASPVMSGTPQASAFRPLRYPTILVGDANLGGVSTTLSAYESLILRGYEVSAVLMFSNPKYRNHEAIAEQIASSIPLQVFDLPPNPPTPRSGTELEMDQKLQDYTNLMVWYEGSDAAAGNVIEKLLASHERRISTLEHMAAKGESKVWWPFTQHTAVKSTTVIDSAYDDSFTVYNPLQTAAGIIGSHEPGTATDSYDACASWWTQSLGHARLPLALTAVNTASRYGHVIFPECVHEPALDLAEGLLRSVGKGWGSRVFYTDNGSTGMEVALKAGLRVVEKAMIESGTLPAKKELGVVGIEGGYHGDTIGVMDAASPTIYNEEVNWYKPRGVWFDPPTVSFNNGQYHVRIPDSIGAEGTTPIFQSLSDLFSDSRSETHAKMYAAHIQQKLTDYTASGNPLGCLIIEPLLLGAGGMIFVDPLFQKVLVSAVRAMRIPLPVIYDEVFVGFHRLGLGIASPGSQLLGAHPDIACYAKNMSGGIVPTSATVVADRIYRAFEGETKKDALLHGHSYTAAPVGCAVAAKALGMYEEMVESVRKSAGPTFTPQVRKHALPGTVGPAIWSEDLIDALSHLPSVDGIVCLGSVLAIELAAAEKGYAASRTSGAIVDALRARGVFARPLGNVVYLMTPYVNAEDAADGVAKVEAALRELLLVK